MDRRETERLLDAIRQARASGEPAALATVVRVSGSAYRREGTRMLVRQDGSFECALSGGCLEPNVAEAAARVIATGEPITMNYDLADDSVWGLGIGCSGAVDVRIERIEDDAIAREWLHILERGETAVLVTPLAGAAGRMIVRDAGEHVGGLSKPELEREAVSHARARLAAWLPASGAETIGEWEIFFEVATPPPMLIVFGAGHDAPPLAQLAWNVGFSVTLVDSREAFLTAERFPNAALVPAHFRQFTERVRVTAGSFVLIMNHHVERDRESLRFALESDTGYIGVLGPRSRYEKLLAALADDGYMPPASRLAVVRSPVGLALGAETPHEVAVAIVSELLATRRGFEGGFLSGSVASLHRPDDQRALATS
jgi:xanthine dehydrogenase accessory factor